MFGRNSKVNLELNREVEKLIKTGGKEQLLPIVQAGEPVLRQQTAAYEGQLSRKTLDKLIETMRVTMIEAPGVGLAATQIGLGLALAVVEDHVRDDDDDDPREAAEFPFHVIINPDRHRNPQLLRRLPELRRLSGGTQALARHHRPLAG